MGMTITHEALLDWLYANTDANGKLNWQAERILDEKLKDNPIRFIIFPCINPDTKEDYGYCVALDEIAYKVTPYNSYCLKSNLANLNEARKFIIEKYNTTPNWIKVCFRQNVAQYTA